MSQPAEKPPHDGDEVHRILADLHGRRVHPPDVVASAMVSGALFLLVEMIGRALSPGTTAFTTPMRIASLLLGEKALDAASPGPFVLALALHAMLSLLYALGICLAIRRIPLSHAVVVGVAFGLAIYLFDYHVLTLVFPQFVAARGVIALTAHAVFGASAAGTFAWLSRRRSSRATPA